jgi:hypothetical protein
VLFISAIIWLDDSGQRIEGDFFASKEQAEHHGLELPLYSGVSLSVRMKPTFILFSAPRGALDRSRKRKRKMAGAESTLESIGRLTRARGHLGSTLPGCD